MKRLQHSLSSQGHERLWAASQAMLPSWYASAPKGVNITPTFLLYASHKDLAGSAPKLSSLEDGMLRLKQVDMCFNIQANCPLRCIDVFRRQPSPVMLRSWRP